MKIAYSFILILLLICHYFLSKKVYGNYFGPAQLYGFILFFLLLLIQTPLIEYDVMSLIGFSIFILTYFVFMFSCGETNKLHWHRLYDKLVMINVKFLDRIWKVCTFFYLILVMVQWVYVIRHFGSIAYIVNNSFSVRMESMGAQIILLLVGYLMGIGFVATGIGSYLFFFKHGGIISKLKYSLSVIITFVSGLADFSRMAVIMHIIVF